MLLTFDWSIETETRVDIHDPERGQADLRVTADKLTIRTGLYDPISSGGRDPDLELSTPGAGRFDIQLAPVEAVYFELYVHVSGSATYAEPALTPVPLPGGLPLALTGLALFGGIAARRRRAG